MVSKKFSKSQLTVDLANELGFKTKTLLLQYLDKHHISLNDFKIIIHLQKELFYWKLIYIFRHYMKANHRIFPFPTQLRIRWY